MLIACRRRLSAGRQRQGSTPRRKEPVVAAPIDPTSTAFLLAENRSMPMHVGGLQLFKKPEGAGRDYVREMYEQMRDVDEVAPLFLKHPHRSLATAGQLVWKRGRAVRHRAPRPPQRAAQARPGPRAARAVLPAAQHPARLGAPAVGGARHRGPARRPGGDVHQDPPRARRRRLGDAAARERALHRPRQARHARAVGRRPSPRRRAGAATDAERRSRRSRSHALRTRARHHRRGRRHARRAGQDAQQGAAQRDVALSLYAPRTIFNQKITGSRRFAAQDWPIERLRGDRQGHRHHASTTS